MGLQWDTQTIIAVYIVYFANLDGVDNPTSMAALNNNTPTIGADPDRNKDRHICRFSPGISGFILRYAVAMFPEFCTYDNKVWPYEEVQAAIRFLYGGGLHKMQLVCEESASLEALEDVKQAVFAAAVAEMERVEGRSVQRRASFERKRPNFTWNKRARRILLVCL